MSIQFGHKFREQHFPLINSKGITSVNHGSYGMLPLVLIEKLNEVTSEFYSAPDKYVFKTHFENYNNALSAMGQFLGCASDNLAFVTGGTVAVNTILRSLPLEKGDVFVIPHTTYSFCKKTFDFLVDTLAVEVVVLDYELPISHDDIIAQFRDVFERKKVKMAFFDTVSSMPSVKLPYRELTSLCAEYGVLSYVDAAHGAGLLPIHFEAMNFKPDFFSTNLHKWLYYPYTFTVLYVDPKHQKSIQTFPITDTYQNPAQSNFFNHKFESQTRGHYMKLAMVQPAIEFRSKICGGEDHILDYCIELSAATKKMVEERWPGARAISNKNNDCLDSAMTTICVPDEISSAFAHVDSAKRAAYLEKLVDELLDTYKTFMPLFFYKEKLCFRVSAQIYNELSDYEYAIDSLKSAITQLIEEHDL